MSYPKRLNRAEQITQFIDLVLKLILRARYENIPIRFGEAHRPVEMAEIYKKRGTGIWLSKHRFGLAVDVWIMDGKGAPVWEDERYKILGAYWKQMGGTWGGDFKRRDEYHFEHKDKPQ